MRIRARVKLLVGVAANRLKGRMATRSAEELEGLGALRARLLSKRAGVLTRYWFEFVRSGRPKGVAEATPPTALSLGRGITAYSLDDARRILRQAVFPLYGQRAVKRRR